MSTLRLPGLNDDQSYKQEKRSTKRTQRKAEDLALADVPERSCLTCVRWHQDDAAWGACADTLVVMERVSPELYPPDGIAKGTVVARWIPPRQATVTCIERGWDSARSYGRAQQLRTHRSFPACDRYDRGESGQSERRGPSLRDRVQGRAA